MISSLAARVHKFLSSLTANEARILIALILSAAACLLFLRVADEIVFEGDHAADRAILLALRDPGDTMRPLGPPWLEEAARDITSLGSTSVLTLVTCGAVFFLMALRRYHSAAYVTLATLGGTLLVQSLKAFLGRDRPDFVPLVAEMTSKSFPSGHSSMSAIVYLTLAALIARILPTFALRAYVTGLAFLVTILVGVSRVYLGFHWPSDVVAGWAIGSAWALLCWSAAQWLEGGARKA